MCYVCISPSYNAAVNQGTKNYLLEQLNGAIANEYSPRRLKRKKAYILYAAELN